MSDPEFLDLDDVLLIHREQLVRFGGGDGLRDQGLLESAIAMPRATFGSRFVHESLFAMAAAYAFHIAESQPFLDGNKRTAILSAIVFLELNGFILVEPPSLLHDWMIAIAERRLDKLGLATLLEKLSRPVESTRGPAFATHLRPRP